jgi:hypothetical protein
MADRQGFEPWIPCGIHAFQACAFSHSAICPLVHPFLGNLSTLPHEMLAALCARFSIVACRTLHIARTLLKCWRLSPAERDGFIARTGSDVAMLEVCGDGWSRPDDRTAARLPFPYTEQPEVERSFV